MLTCRICQGCRHSSHTVTVIAMTTCSKNSLHTTPASSLADLPSSALPRTHRIGEPCPTVLQGYVTRRLPFTSVLDVMLIVFSGTFHSSHARFKGVPVPSVLTGDPLA